MTAKQRPDLRQFTRGFHLGAPNEEHPLGTFTEFDAEDEIKHRHPGTSLGFKQGLVGGLIEPLHFVDYYKLNELSDDHDEYFWDVYGFEEARLIEQPVNIRASAILGHEIAGDVIFIPRSWRLEDK
jgi:hypothetical protein